MPPSSDPSNSKDSKKSSTSQPRNNNNNNNNNGSAVHRRGGGGNTNNGSRNSTNSSSLVAHRLSGGGGGPPRPGFFRGPFDLDAWLADAGVTDPSSAITARGNATSSANSRPPPGGNNHRTLTTTGGRSGGGGSGSGSGGGEIPDIPDFSSSSLARLDYDNMTAAELRAITEYMFVGVHSAQALRRGSSRRAQFHMELMRRIAQETLESKAMASHGLQEIDRLGQDVGGNGAAASAAFDNDGAAQSNVPATNRLNNGNGDSNSRSRRTSTFGTGHDVGGGGGGSGTCSLRSRANSTAATRLEGRLTDHTDDIIALREQAQRGRAAAAANHQRVNRLCEDLERLCATIQENRRLREDQDRRLRATVQENRRLLEDQDRRLRRLEEEFEKKEDNDDDA